ncbi:hypothetical protein LAV72_02310 [Lysinibacillus xylanilyticus]|uniref:hypothetical protein n=1 Tax=Lysinibacillus xylanilyticus TaxID=582475 RepID=UPI002B252832|nr:hypothetical protein [Lysinibacillus xylanilyticus]MEB2298461.1 hypothetical protein [Lysinibacillus xylanilyticus]
MNIFLFIKYPRKEGKYPRLEVEYPRKESKYPRLEVEYPRKEGKYPRKARIPAEGE